MSKTKETKNKFVKHIRDHKSEYITGAICLTVGALGGVVVTRKPNGPIDMQALNKFNVGINWKSTTNQTNNVVKALGHPGFKVLEIATGIERPSINNTAHETGLSVTKLAQHLHGDLSDVDGRHFKITGVADTSHLA
jgi:hypothetical protein